MNNKETIGTCLNWKIRSEWERWTGSNKCPNCGSGEIEYNTLVVLTSNPPQSQLRCKSCGHYFSSGFKSECTDNDALNKLWQHTQSILEIPQVGDWPVAPMPCDPLPNYPSNMNYGWICPKCGSVLAPHVSSCPHCSPATTINITY